MPHTYPAALKLNHIDPDHHPKIGHRALSLAHLHRLGLPIPRGYVVTPAAFRQFVSQNNLNQKIKHTLEHIDPHNPESIKTGTRQIQKYIRTTTFTSGGVKQLHHVYRHQIGKNWCLIESTWSKHSHHAKDSGIQAYKGDSTVTTHIRHLWSDAFNHQNIFDYLVKKDSHAISPPSLLITAYQPWSVSGQITTTDQTNRQKQIIVIEAVWGGLLHHRGIKLIPDVYRVDKTDFQIVSQHVSQQHQRVCLNRYGHFTTTKVSSSQTGTVKLTDRAIIHLAKLSLKAHNHFLKPQVLTWSLDQGNLLFHHAHTLPPQHPVTPTKSINSPATGNLSELAKGLAASPGLVSAPIAILKHKTAIGNTNSGDIILIPSATLDYLPAMKKAAGIVSLEGGPTSHLSIIAREISVPMITGLRSVPKGLRQGTVVTLNGETGQFFKGGIPPNAASPTKPLSSPLVSPTKTATKLYISVADEKVANKVAHSDASGIGLLRGDYLLASFGSHPKSFSKSQSQQYLDHLIGHIGSISQSFGHRPVYYLLSDFQSTDYATLKNGQRFEPKESNPFLGYRGSLRHLTDQTVLDFELKAISHLRHKFNQKNIHLILPFIRSTSNIAPLKRHIAAFGLHRAQSFQILVSIDTPAMAMSIGQIAKSNIDGISINLDHLSPLILGIDPNNQEVNPHYNPQHPSITDTLSHTIRQSHQHRLSSIVRGYALTKYTDLVSHAVIAGATGITVPIGSYHNARQLIQQAESKLIQLKTSR